MRIPLALNAAPRSARTRLALAALALISLAAAGMKQAEAASSVTSDSVLVVGDSIVSQADTPTRWWAPKGSTVWVHGGPGSAPCDWDGGYRDPFTGAWYQLSGMVDRYRPAAVVLAFSGNPGFSGTRAGCVDTRTTYGLSDLLSSYQRALVDMARYATAHGARVYLAASPPRNPQTPPGAYRGSGGSHEYGFNGVPELNRLLAAIAGSPEGRADGWVYDDNAAVAVSDASLTWHLTETCAPWDVSAGNCRSDAQAQVRAGGFDAVHLDLHGAGATRYGIAVVRRPLYDEGYPG